MMFDDIRSFIDATESLGEVRRLEGADWDLEIGAITMWQAQYDNSPLLLFDNIKGYKTGYRVATNLYRSPRRIALALGLPSELSGLDVVNAWRKRLRNYEPVPPVEVDTGVIGENVYLGEHVDLFMFPSPKWNRDDGGRYIGTGHVVITKDPEEGWVNVGCYRSQIHEKNVVTVVNAPGKDMDIIKRRYWAKGEACPVAIACSPEPVLWAVAQQKVPWGESEYNYAGFLKGKPIEVIKGPKTGLPIPATAEIAFEGELLPPESGTVVEGPFGEWTGYYGRGSRPEPIVRVTSVLHRNNPILQGVPNIAGYVSASGLAFHIQRASVLWNHLDSAYQGITGVWVLDESGGYAGVIVSLKQMYPGHAKQIALAAAAFLAFHLGFLIVVDDDIDPSNISQVLYAMSVRCDPEMSVDIIKGIPQSPLMPAVSPEKKELGDFTRGIVIINACKPYYQVSSGRYPKECKLNPELLQQVEEKWSPYLR